MLNKIVIGKSLHHFTKEREEKRSEILANREFEFVHDKINVLVGENGSGKSSLLATIAKKLLAYNYGHTRLDDRLLRFADEYWQKDDPERWYSEDLFMPDVTIESSSPLFCTYVAADWSPCDSPNFAYALCTGLEKEAKRHYHRVENFSSGQGMSNVIANTLELIAKRSPEIDLKEVEWHLKERDRTHMSKRAFTLREVLPPAGSNIVALFDEPERTLDLTAQFAFWRLLSQAAKLSHVQIIVATHSIIPLMSPDNFNFVEMNDGYTKRLLDISKEEFKQ